jgi:hypothetical protein
MTQVKPLVLKRLQCNPDLIPILGKKSKGKESSKKGGSIFHSLNLSGKNI